MNNLGPEASDEADAQKERKQEVKSDASLSQQKPALKDSQISQNANFLSLGPPGDLLWQCEDPSIRAPLMDLTNKLGKLLKDVDLYLISAEVVEAINKKFKDNKEFPNLELILTFTLLAVLGPKPREKGKQFLTDHPLFSHPLFSLTVSSGSPGDLLWQDPKFNEYVDDLKNRLRTSINEHTKNIIFDEILEATKRFKDNKEFPYLSTVLTATLIGLLEISPREEGAAFLRNHLLSLLPSEKSPCITPSAASAVIPSDRSLVPGESLPPLSSSQALPPAIDKLAQKLGSIQIASSSSSSPSSPSSPSAISSASSSLSSSSSSSSSPSSLSSPSSPSAISSASSPLSSLSSSSSSSPSSPSAISSASSLLLTATLPGSRGPNERPLPLLSSSQPPFNRQIDKLPEESASKPPITSMFSRLRDLMFSRPQPGIAPTKKVRKQRRPFS